MIGLELIHREWDEEGSLFVDNITDNSRIVIPPATLMCRLGAPETGLAVQILQRRVGAGGKEGVADILDGPFNTPLLIATCRTTGTGFKMIVGTELEDPRVNPRRAIWRYSVLQ